MPAVPRKERPSQTGLARQPTCRIALFGSAHMSSFQGPGSPDSDASFLRQAPVHNLVEATAPVPELRACAINCFSARVSLWAAV